MGLRPSTRDHAEGRTQTGRLAGLANCGTLALLVVSVVLNLVQARRLDAFRDPAPELSPGAAAPTLIVTTLDGRPTEIRFERQPTLLYYFSPKCPWCERNWTGVRALVAATSGHARFIGLSTVPDVSTYLASHHLSFEVYTGLSLDTVRAYHFAGTPETVVISADGRIEHVWSGAFAGRSAREIEHTFGLVLPKLPPAPQP
jgi:peroxiredoxin